MATVVPGALRVSNDCIADLAGYAALECYGVVGMAVLDEQGGVAHLLPTYRLRRGITVSSLDVERGVNISSVSDNLVSSVKFVLKQIAELDDVDVCVHIDALRTR